MTRAAKSGLLRAKEGPAAAATGIATERAKDDTATAAPRAVDDPFGRLLRITPKQRLQRSSLLAASQNPLELFVVQGVLAPEECKAIVKLCEEGQQPALAWSNVSHPSTRDVAARNNDRISFNSATFAETLWSAGLDRLFEDVPSCQRGEGRAVGLNAHFRVYRYVAGMLFGQHYDEPVEDASRLHVSEYTLLVYLCGGPHDEGQAAQGLGERLVGGETLFYRGQGKGQRQVAAASPVAGLALLHTQGPQSLLHESAAVQRGVKYVLRSDVMFDKAAKVAATRKRK